jgi:hypothetical protein
MQKITDAGSGETGSVTALVPKAQDEIAGAEGRLQGRRYKEPGEPATGTFEDVRLWDLIPKLIPKGINRARKNPLRCKGFSPDLVEVAGVEPASEGV